VPAPTSISLTGGAGSGLSLTPEATGFTATGPAIPGSEELFTQQIPIEGVSLGTTSGFQASLPEVSSVSLTSADPTATSFETGLGGGVTPTLLRQPQAVHLLAQKDTLVIKQLVI
jgi:hypothetical protein